MITIIYACDLPEGLPQPEPPQSFTLSQIIVLEPKIGRILEGVAHKRSAKQNHEQYNRAKKNLTPLVGWGAEQIELRTSRAWHAVLEVVVGKLWPGRRYGRP